MPGPVDSRDRLGSFDWSLRSVAPRYRIAALAGFALVYAALNVLGYELRVQHGTLVIIWPAAGLLLVALFLAPPRIWIWLLSLQLCLGVLIDYLLAQQFRLAWSVLFAMANSVDAVVGATLAIRLIQQPAQPRIRQVIAFFAAAALGAAASASIGAFCAIHVLTDGNYLHQWQVWWAGNWMGSLAITPVALTWAVRLRLPDLAVRKVRRLELVVIAAVLMGMTQWIFSASPVSMSVTTFLQLPPILLALLVVAAFRLPPRWSTTLAAAVVLLAADLSSRGLGPFAAEPDLFARIGSLQIFLATLLVFTFMLATVLLEKRRAFEQLNTSEERYRHFVTHSSEAVWRVELEQPMPMGLPADAQLAWLKQHARIAECNLSYQRLQPADGAAPSDYWRVDVPWAAIYLEHLDSAARQGYSMDGLRFTLPGDAGPQVYLANFSGVIADSKLVRIWGVARNITQIADLNERLRREQERLQAYARQLVGAEERARRTIAVNLQQGVERQLAELNMTVDAIASRSPAGLRQLLDGLRATLAEVQEYTRRLIEDVSPPGLYDIGLGAALQWLAIYTRGRDALHVALTVRLNEQVLALNTRVLIFQVIRELLRNVAAHAGVDSAQVNVTQSVDELTIEVIDDGTGFDWQYDLFTDPARGFGLFSVADRVRSANGRLAVDTAPGKGCRVTVHFPLAASLVFQLP
jgi:signal transduction histidine kinase